VFEEKIGRVKQRGSLF